MLIWIAAIASAAVLFFVLDTGRMKRIHSEIRAAYIDEGLEYDEADKVAWYLVDMFIYMRKHKNSRMAKIVMTSMMTVVRQRLYSNEAYAGHFAAKMQMEGIRDACLLYNRPVFQSADLVYDSVVASYEDSVAGKPKSR